MTITWHGYFTIKIVTAGTTIILDPYAPHLATTPFKAKAEIVALSSPQDPLTSHLEGIQGEPQVINTPGEFSLAGVTLHARAWHDKQNHEHSLQRWRIEDIILLHVGARNQPLTDNELQELERTDIDILLLPVGGHGTFDTKQALEILTVIEPSIVVPINFATKKAKEKLNDISTFAKEMGVRPSQTEARLNISSRKIDRDNLTTTILAA